MDFNRESIAVIEKSLRNGGVLHAFLSGGGLRVLRVEEGRHGALLGYGEHPHVADAFRILADDLATGGRPYEAVYGPVETPYLTGASEPQDALDAWIRGGRTFDALSSNGSFVVELHGYEHAKTPKDVMES